MGVTSSFSGDEGAVAVQARSLSQDHSWRSEHPSADLEGGRYFAYKTSAQQTARGWFVFAKHPLHVLAVAGLAMGFGLTAALYLIPITGAVLTACAAWWMSDLLGQGRPHIAFWLTAASPVSFYAYLSLGHTIAAALGGAAVVGVIRYARTTDSRWLAAGVAALCVATCFRREMVLFAIALGLAVVVLGRTVGIRRRLLVGALLGGMATATWLAELWAIRRIVGDGAVSLAGLTRDSSDSYLSGRIRGIGKELMLSSPSWGDPRTTWALGIAAVLVVSALLMRARGRVVYASAAVWCTVLLYAGWTLIPVPRHFTGLLVAWPIAVIGVLLIQRDDLAPEERVAAFGLGGFTALVFLLQYEIGGAAGWGPRYLLPATAPLCALIAPRLFPAPSSALADARIARPMTGLVAISALASLLTLTAVRDRGDAVLDKIAALPADAVISLPGSLPQRAWSWSGSDKWYQTEPDDLPTLLRHMRSTGVKRIVLVAPSGTVPQGLDALGIEASGEPWYEPWQGWWVVPGQI